MDAEPCKVLLPDFVTTFTTADPERPNSAEKRLVALWNSCTASSGTFTSMPPTASSLLSMPSMLTFPPRPNCPAEEITTVFALVGSKFGAIVLPGVSSASSRKLRPFNGRFSIWRASMTPSTTDETVFTRGTESLSSMTMVVFAPSTERRSLRFACCPT